jgi:hypothetical protein
MPFTLNVSPIFGVSSIGLRIQSSGGVVFSHAILFALRICAVCLLKLLPPPSICRHETTRNPLRWIFVIFDVGKCNQHFPSPASICVNRTKLRAIWYEDLRAFLPYFQSKSLNIWRSGKWWSLHCGAKYSKHLRIDRFSGKSFHFRDN